MTERIAIDQKYTYVFDQGSVSLERYAEPWICDPDAPKAWIAAASEIERLREQVAALQDRLAQVGAEG